MFSQKFPNDFRKQIVQILPNEHEVFFESLHRPSDVSIRINKGKAVNRTDILEDYIGNSVPWCNTAYYLTERPVFTLDPLFHAGVYYVQEASSTFLEQCVLEIKKHSKIERVLDLCAAPGGKSTHLSALIDDALLVSNEVIRSRANILLENMEKWGATNVVVTNNDPKDFKQLTHFFDLIWVDAPCSGEGMFRKDPRAIEEWSEDNVKLCVARGRRILSDIWSSLAPGGFLAYSTCTFNHDENEATIEWLKNEYGAESINIPICPEWNISPSLSPDIFAYRFYPHKVHGEGFFVSIVRKPFDRRQNPKYKTQKKTIKFEKEWLMDKDWSYYSENNTIYACESKYLQDMDLLNQKLRILGKGIRLAEVKGKDVIPTYSMAINQQLNPNCFPSQELDEKTALLYLKKESIQVSPNLAQGYLLITHKGIILGLVKKIQNRVNNLFPSSWKIRMKLNT